MKKKNHSQRNNSKNQQKNHHNPLFINKIHSQRTPKSTKKKKNTIHIYKLNFYEQQFVQKLNLNTNTEIEPRIKKANVVC